MNCAELKLAMLLLAESCGKKIVRLANGDICIYNIDENLPKDAYEPWEEILLIKAE